MGRRKFELPWNELAPHISCMKPTTDLCPVCQENIVKITRSANLTLSEKSDQILETERHLSLAQQERSVYNEECLMSSKELQDNTACPKFTHISFDFAQHYIFQVVHNK